MGCCKTKGKTMGGVVQMNYKKDDQVNAEIKKLLKEELRALEEVSISKVIDKVISKKVSKP